MEIETKQHVAETTGVTGGCVELCKVPACKKQKDGLGFNYKNTSLSL